MTEKLILWGAVHAAARDAERALAQQGEGRDELARQAKVLRDKADRLHREAYAELGSARRTDAQHKPR